MTASGIRTAGFRGLTVVRKVVESSLITSFYLAAADGTALPPFRPGQFLVFKIPSDAAKGHVLRHYSLSGDPQNLSHYRISVKREPSAGPGLPVGLSSNYLHDHVDAGSVLQADGPRGDFVLDHDSDRPVVLLSGGVGLTPMVAMFHALSRSDRRTLFLHACENGDVHALRDEVEQIAARRLGLSTHVVYRTPRESDQYDSAGIVTRDLLQRLLCLDDYQVYLCGPAPFMQAMYGTLRGLGVAEDRIAYEFFGPATVLEREPAPKPAPPPVVAPVAGTKAITVEFRTSGRTAIWSPDAESLLSFAEDQGLTPAFSCRAGICSTCKSHLVSGNVEYFEDPLDDLEPGEVLLCCTRPTSAIVLDI